MKRPADPRLLLSLSMAIFGTLGLFTRNIAVSSGELALYRAILATVLLGAYLLLRKQPIRFGQIRRELPLLLFSGVAMGINWILLFQAYRYTSISVATLSYYFAPVLVTIACPLLFGEKLTAKQILCFLMSTLGLVLLTGLGDLKAGADLRGILFGLGAACFYAAVVLINKFIKGVEGIHRTVLQFMAAVVTLLPYVLLSGPIRLGELDGLGWACLLTVGLVHTGLTYCMYFSALKELPGQKAAILSYVDPLVAVLVSVLILRESITLWQGVGGLLILGFTLWNELSPGGEEKKSANT